MIVAAGPLQLPAFEEARLLGCRIVAVDGSANAPGMRLADRSYQIDIKQGEAIVAIGRTEEIAGVMSICTDFAVKTVAAVAEALGLPGLPREAASKATDKRLMRRAFAASRVPSPQFAEVSGLESAIGAAGQFGYPVALKIPRSAGSRGVYRVATPAELLERYAQARSLEPSQDLLVEQWLTGPEVSVEGCCVGPDPRIVQITDKLLFTGPNPVEAGHTQPSRLPADVQEEIRRTTAAGVRALGLEDCGFHAELKVTTGGPRVIEIAARLGGDRIATHLTPLSTGVNLVRAVIELALGRKPALEASRKRGAAIRYFQVPVVGFLDRVNGLDALSKLPGIECLSLQTEHGEALKPGLHINPVQSSLDRCGNLIFSGSDANEAAARAEAAIRSVSFTIQPDSRAAGPRSYCQPA
jgi:biotin carboxylase